MTARLISASARHLHHQPAHARGNNNYQVSLLGVTQYEGGTCASGTNDDHEPIHGSRPALSATNVSAEDRAAILSDESYWRKLCDWLHVGDEKIRARFASAILEPHADLIDECRDRMMADGYWQIQYDAVNPETGSHHLNWDLEVSGLARGVERLVEAGWPPNFILMYDETWLLVHQLKHIVLLSTGNRLSYDFSVFHVGAGSAGWPPHRDRGGDSTGAFRTDKLPQYCTTWIALSDATCARNGIRQPATLCLSLLNTIEL